MALVVEDGTGRDDAESYVTVLAFQTYCTAWGLALTGAHTEAVIETALRKATAFIDTAFRYKAARLRAEQALEFPRAGLTDWSGLLVTGVPPRTKRACADLAWKALAENLLEDLDRGGRIVSESVGPISTSYAADAPAGKVYQLAEKLLAPFVRRDDASLIRGPGFTPPGTGLFEFGMHDAPGGDPLTEP